MRRTLSILLLAAVAWPACACNIPVFRFALENWGAQPYQVLVFSHGLLPADAQPLLKSLQDSTANLGIAVVDVDKPSSPDALKLWQAQGMPALPWLAVRFPNGETLAWSGALDAATLAALLDSPARKQLRQQLLGGDSAVWVLLESGDAPRDDKIAALLEKQSGDLAKRLQLSGGPGSAVVNESLLLSGLPLKLEFSVVRVARTAPEEKFFAALLLQPEFNPHPDNLESAEPLVFPVFGRGRAMPALKEKDLLPKALTDAAEFLTGMCSDDIQELNPGADLLISADWENELMAGNYQRTFIGKFADLSDVVQKLGPDVVGSFDTDASGKKPGRKYLVRVEKGNQAVLETLKRLVGKTMQITGKLRDIGPDGEAKYLIVTSVNDDAATRSPVEHRKAGGL